MIELILCCTRECNITLHRPWFTVIEVFCPRIAFSVISAMSHFPINNTTPGGKSSYKKGMTHKKYLIDENVIPVCPWKLCAKPFAWCVNFHLSHSSSKTLNPKFLHSERKSRQQVDFTEGSYNGFWYCARGPAFHNQTLHHPTDTPLNLQVAKEIGYQEPF